MSTQNAFAEAIDRRIRAVLDASLGGELDRRIQAAVLPLLEAATARIEQNLAAGLVGAGLVQPRAAVAKVAYKAGPVAISAPRAAAKPAAKKPGRPKQFVGADGAGGCFLAGCKRDYRSKGYCSAHYQAARKNGWPLPPPSQNWTPPASR